MLWALSVTTTAAAFHLLELPLVKGKRRVVRSAPARNVGPARACPAAAPLCGCCGRCGAGGRRGPGRGGTHLSSTSLNCFDGAALPVTCSSIFVSGAQRRLIPIASPHGVSACACGLKLQTPRAPPPFEIVMLMYTMPITASMPTGLSRSVDARRVVDAVACQGTSANPSAHRVDSDQADAICFPTLPPSFVGGV